MTSSNHFKFIKKNYKYCFGIVMILFMTFKIKKKYKCVSGFIFSYTGVTLSFILFFVFLNCFTLPRFIMWQLFCLKCDIFKKFQSNVTKKFFLAVIYLKHNPILIIWILYAFNPYSIINI